MTEERDAPPAEHHLEPEAIVQLIDRAVRNYSGQYPALDRAIGMYFATRDTGWKPLFLMRDKRKIREAEEILGINFREHFPEVGPNADRSAAWRASKAVSSFWRAVRGDYPDVRSSEVTAVSKETS